jgi:exodeoxyribonuclease VIII
VEKVVYEDGVYNITSQQYHASAGISRSMLMDFKRNPYYYWYKHLSGLCEPEEPTSAMVLGSAVHTLVLEEEKFDVEFYVTHQLKRPQKGTPPHDLMKKKAEGRMILTPPEYEQALKMASAIHKDEQASELLKGCVIEQSIYFTHQKTGLQCKSRPDAWSGSIVLDLKTTANAGKEAFKSSAVRYGYFLQGAIAHQAIESIGQIMDHFVFIPIEKEPPYCTAIYMIDDDTMTKNLQRFDDLMEGLARCYETNKWPSYGIQDLSEPKWADYEELAEIE